MIDIRGVREAFAKRWELKDLDVIDILCAWVVANREKREPVFLLLVGEPSSLKTQLATVFAELPDAYLIGSLTEKTLLSGLTMGKKGNESLLPKLSAWGKTLLVNKEFGSIFSMRQDKREDLLNQYREIYDGHVCKNFGTGERVEWKGFLGVLGCSVPVVDNSQIMMAKLGDRFIMWRVRDELPESAMEASLGAVWKQNRGRDGLVDTLNEFFNGLRQTASQVSLGVEMKRELFWCAEFLAKARGRVSWGSGVEGDDIMGVNVERPIRICNTLYMMAVALAVVRGKASIGPGEMALVERLAMDTIPAQRYSVFRSVLKEPKISARVVEELGFSRRVANRRLMELKALGLVSRDRDAVFSVKARWLKMGNLNNVVALRPST